MGRCTPLYCTVLLEYYTFTADSKAKQSTLTNFWHCTLHIFNNFAFFFVVMYWRHLMTRWELAVFYGNNMFKVHAGKWKCGTQHNSQGYRFLEFITCADGTTAYFHVFIRYLFQNKWGEKGEKAQKHFCVLLLFGFVLMLCHGKFVCQPGI